MTIIDLAMPQNSNQGEHPHLGAAALENCYPVLNGVDQKVQISIRAAAGLDPVATLTAAGGVRGMLEVDGVALVVAGRSLYQIDTGGSETLVGAVVSDGHVGMTRNQRGVGVQTAIVCDGEASVVVGGTQTAMTLPIAPVDCCTINQSTIYGAGNGVMMRSEINDCTSVDPLDTATANASSDQLLRLVAQGIQFLGIGERSTEVWQDVAGEAFGFARAHVIEVGAVGARSVVKGTILAHGGQIDDTVAWCVTNSEGRTAGVCMLNGYTPTKISTPYVDRLIDIEADKTAIIGTHWIERGHAMFGWRLTDRTVVYDTSTQRWHERRSRTTAGLKTTWRVGRTISLGGKILAGDAVNPKLYWLDPDTYDEAGDELIVTLIPPPISAEPGQVDMGGGVYLDMVPGTGLVSGSSQDVAPMVSMHTARNGVTWGNERKRALGAAAQTKTRLYWSRCGTHDQISLQFSCSAAVAREFLSAHYEGGAVRP